MTKPSNKARMLDAIARQKAGAKPAAGGTECPTCGTWARAGRQFLTPHHPDCPRANRDAGRPRPDQAERRQRRIDKLFARLPDGTHMEQTYLRARGWMLKMVVPVVQAPGTDAPWSVEFFHTGPTHLKAIEELYLKYRDWLTANAGKEQRQ